MDKEGGDGLERQGWKDFGFDMAGGSKPLVQAWALVWAAIWVSVRARSLPARRGKEVESVSCVGGTQGRHMQQAQKDGSRGRLRALNSSLKS
jgi:hypothetical protein